MGRWIDKVKNKSLDYDVSIDVIKNSDIIVYQEISKEKSEFSNIETLRVIKKESCKLIIVPSIYLDYSDYENSIKELQKREIHNKVDILVSDIFEKYREQQLMLTIWHPSTFLFLEIVNEICNILNIETFSKTTREMFLQDDNYMQLP